MKHDSKPATKASWTKAFRGIERLEEELAGQRQVPAEPIAIVGMACRFPGADDLGSFWALLREGRNAISEVPAERWDIDAYYDPDPDVPGKMSTRFGGFLPDIDRFDAQFFNIAPREAALMDPQQRLLLELSWQAFEDAAIAPDRLEGAPIGVFVGVPAADYLRLAALDPENLNAYWGTGSVGSVAAGRLAYTFGFTGPCLALDTACSSALVAVHLACDSLRKGDCTAALVASASLTLSPDATIAFSKARMMSPDGRCYTFDERANGYVRSEGAAALVLKPLSQAQADGDRIMALIRGSAINQDGASGGLTVPSGPAQVALIREALAKAGVSPDEVDYIEAHGTGTSLGDPIEVGALGEVFGDRGDAGRPLLLGSVKSLIGHMEIAAGMGGLIKLVLSLQEKTITGYPGLGRRNPHISWDHLPVAVPTECQPWPAEGKPRIAGISAFGFSGTNAHLVVQEAPIAAQDPPDDAQPGYLLCLSAKTEAALQAAAGRYAEVLAGDAPGTLDAVCWTANVGRAALPYRLAVAAAHRSELADRLSAFARTGEAAPGLLQGVAPPLERRLAFLFSGQGSQYRGMGRELYCVEPRFRAAIDRCEALLGDHLDLPLTEVLWGEAADRLKETAYTQPALFALEYALADLWRGWGIEPAFVTGHSVGEFAAACIAGVFDLADGLKLIAARGRLMQALPRGGAMAVVSAGRAALAEEVEGLSDRLSFAAFNAPDQTVISGDRDAVLELCERLRTERQIANKGLLDVSHAFHSPLMHPMLEAFRAVAESVSYSQPELGFVSSVTGCLAGEEVARADYWVDHVLAPVDFLGGMAALRANEADLFLEIGPKATLIGLARAQEAEVRLECVASLREGVSDWAQILRALGTLYGHGMVPDWRWAGRCGQSPPAKLALPSYPFQRERHWLKVASGSARSHVAAAESHPLLGRLLPVAALAPGDFLYETVCGATNPRYLQDHKVHDKVVMPAAAYVEIVLAGARTQFPGQAAVLTNLSVQAALVLPPDGEVSLQCLFTDMAERRFQVKILSTPVVTGEGAAQEPAVWRTHATCQIELSPEDEVADPPPINLGELRNVIEQEGEKIEIGGFYQRYGELGLSYGPEFQTVAWLGRGAGDPGQCLAHVTLPARVREGRDLYVIPPTLLDGCFQALAALFGRKGVGTCYLPIGIERARVWHPAKASLWSHAVLRRQPDEGDPRFTADLHLVDDEGRTIAKIDGLQALPVDRRALAQATAGWMDKFYALQWQAQPRGDEAALVSDSALGAWLVLGGPRGVGRELVALLSACGHECHFLTPDEILLADKAAWAELIAGHFRGKSLPLIGIVHLWAADGAAGESGAVQERLCASTLALVQALMEQPDQQLPRLWLMTAGALAVGDDGPSDIEQATLWGFGRSIAQEHSSLNCTLLDLDPAGVEPKALIAELLRPLPESQIAYRGGRRYVARLHQTFGAATKRALEIPTGAYRLRTANYGTFDHLCLRAIERRAPASDELEIEIAAAAVNFKDVLFCLGMLREFSEKIGITQAIEQPLGFECAGRIVRVGDAVRDLEIGDEVFAMAPSAMASHVTIERRLVHRKPHGLSFEEAASLPTVFMTALYSLERLARLKAGETILIHAGAGGVGQAALQIARKIGATIYATASPGKWEFLKRQGVALVMNSRTLDFAGEIGRLTGGRGVDVVLNSLTGDYIPRSADVLAPGGRFVEIGKIGIWDGARMAAYRPDIEYFSFDLGDIDDTAGELRAELLHDVVEGVETGSLAALPVRSFPLGQAASAFHYLAQAKNIGKVVISLPPFGQAAFGLRPDRSYLITGGMGALGLHVAASLIRLGARQIILGGRTAPDEQVRQAIDALSVSGADVQVRILDVTDMDSLSSTFAWIHASCHPLGGLVHAAGMLDDGIVLKQSWQRFSNVLAPKVTGAWNLHRASEPLKLDFFILFSSIASILGSPGQASYAAANAYLDALAQFRRSRGLPALSINWGPWAGHGMAERTRAATKTRFDSLGLSRLSIADNVEAFEYLLNQDVAGVALLDLNWSKYLKSITSPAIANFYSPLERGSRGKALEEVGALLEKLREKPASERETALALYLRDHVAEVLGVASADSIGTHQPLLKMGIDSLMAVQLKNRLEAGLRCTLNPTVLFDHPTIDALAAHLTRNVLHFTTLAATPVVADPAPVARPDAEGEGGPARLSGMEEQFIAVEGRNLCVCRWAARAEAPMVICTHGWLDQAAIWDEMAVGLVAAGYQVLAFDFRSHGRSDYHPAGANLTIMELLLDLKSVIAAFAPKQITLVGHSTGAVVSGLFAGLFPDRVERLIMVEPVMPGWRGAESPLATLDTDLQYLQEPPPHPIYSDIMIAARMLTLNHPALSKARSLALARRITEPCPGGWRWRWDVRLRNPLGATLLLPKAQYLSIIETLKMPWLRFYGTTSQFAGTPVLLDPALDLPRSHSEFIEGGHNLHTDAPARLLHGIIQELSGAG